MKKNLGKGEKILWSFRKKLMISLSISFIISMGAGGFERVKEAEPQKASTQQLWGGKCLHNCIAILFFEPK